jgi:hypothetical protein
MSEETNTFTDEQLLRASVNKETALRLKFPGIEVLSLELLDCDHRGRSIDLQVILTRDQVEDKDIGDKIARFLGKSNPSPDNVRVRMFSYLGGWERDFH